MVYHIICSDRPRLVPSPYLFAVQGDKRLGGNEVMVKIAGDEKTRSSLGTMHSQLIILKNSWEQVCDRPDLIKKDASL